MVSRFRFAAFAAAVLMCAAGAAFAEPLGSHFELSPIGAVMIYDGNFRYPGNSPLTDDIYAGGRVGWQKWKRFAVEGAFGFAPTSEDVANGRDVDFWHTTGEVMFYPWPNRYGSPFLFGGLGYGNFSSNGFESLKMGLGEFGGGAVMWITDVIGVRAEARSINWLRDKGDKPKYQHLMLGGGLTFAVGATPRDTDGDGVPDKKDKCPDTPKGAKVDVNGCPLDTDGDKVYDGIDQCPDTPKGATVDAKGCPSDQDGDGVDDGIDQCADTPKGATVDATGCPKDSDGDGVLDGIDKCPDTPKGAVVDTTGCPVDSDGDGVPDGIDQCPGTPAGMAVDATGCPTAVKALESEMFDTGMVRASDITFDTGKATLQPASNPKLDAVGLLMKKWPQLKFEVGGHTDSKGAAAANQKLSQQRAQTVKDYLTQKYPDLKPEQMTVKGYGEAKPIVPNTTPDNMAKNRRIEFVVTNKDVLKAATPPPAAPPITPSPAAPDTTKH